MILKRLVPLFAILKLGPDADLPAWAIQAATFFIARTSDELSIMCPQGDVPDAIEASRNWVCFRVDGDLEFDEVGVVARASAPLADNGLSLFLVSTHDRDYVFVHQNDVERAIQIYETIGFTVTSEAL
ncbi:MAG: ACT domain-containing protein [Anaerolineales bacterium]|nr:ACT domain-containing protein [Anaerolineales bacterium]